MNYRRWLYERNGEIFLEVTDGELIELAKDLGFSPFSPNGEIVTISSLLENVSAVMYNFHDINLRLIHPQG